MRVVCMPEILSRDPVRNAREYEGVSIMKHNTLSNAFSNEICKTQKIIFKNEGKNIC